MSEATQRDLTPIVGNVATLVLELQATVQAQAVTIASLTKRVEATEQLIKDIHALSVEELGKG